MLEHIFSSKTRVKLLEFFLRNKEKEFFVRELVRLTGEHLNSIRRELQNLQEFGLIEYRDENKKKYYHINQSFPLLAELSSLFFKPEVNSDDDFQARLLEFPEPELIILAGVFTNTESPVDILIVAQSLDRSKLTTLLNEYSEKHGTALRFAVMAPEDYQYRRSIQDKFVYSILNQPKIMLKDRALDRAASQES